jgi:flagellar biosynthesis/type III secretory pathway M-ring protein FliF/YscJ
MMSHSGAFGIWQWIVLLIIIIAIVAAVIVVIIVSSSSKSKEQAVESLNQQNLNTDRDEDGLITKLKDLKDLSDSGLITEKEYKQKKEELLNKL